MIAEHSDLPEGVMDHRDLAAATGLAGAELAAEFWRRVRVERDRRAAAAR